MGGILVKKKRNFDPSSLFVTEKNTVGARLSSSEVYSIFFFFNKISSLGRYVEKTGSVNWYPNFTSDYYLKHPEMK